MSELGEHRLTVELEKTGEVFDNVQSYRLNSNYLTPTDEWEFVVYDHDNPAALRRIWQPWQRVKLYIDGELQVIGRIDETEGVGASSSALAVRGRDHLAELVDGGADPSIRFTEKMDLGAALLLLFRPFGIKTLVGSFSLTRNLLTGRVPYVGDIRRDFRAAQMKEFSVGQNMGAFEVGDKIVSRHGFTIQSGGSRDSLAIVEPLFGQEPLYELNRPGNVLTGKARRGYADVPTVTIATCRLGSTGGKLGSGLAEFPSFGEEAPNEIGKNDEVKRIAFGNLTGGEIPNVFISRIDWKQDLSPASGGILYKPLFYEDKESRTQEQLERGLRRELSRRMKDTLVYTCNVRGHRDPISKAVYAIDTVAAVNDEIEDVNENMWLLDRTFSNDGKGPVTDMQFVRPGSIAL